MGILAQKLKTVTWLCPRCDRVRYTTSKVYDMMCPCSDSRGSIPERLTRMEPVNMPDTVRLVWEWQSW